MKSEISSLKSQIRHLEGHLDRLSPRLQKDLIEAKRQLQALADADAAIEAGLAEALAGLKRNPPKPAKCYKFNPHIEKL